MKILFITLLCSISICSYSQTGCDTTLCRHVYHPKRLIVQEQSYITVTGIVRHIKKEADGDYHIQLKVDSEFEQYVDFGNYERQDSCIVLESICACKIKQKDAIEACQDYENQIMIPKKGDYIRVTGSYVYDKSGAHGWTEIHPVSKIEFLN